MNTPPEPPISETELPPHLRRLRQLVTVLTLAMIAGVITITALLVIRLNAPAARFVIDPGAYAMPTDVVGYSVLGDRVVMVGADRVIRVFDAESHALIESFTLSE